MAASDSYAFFSADDKVNGRIAFEEYFQQRRYAHLAKWLASRSWSFDACFSGCPAGCADGAGLRSSVFVAMMGLRAASTPTSSWRGWRQLYSHTHVPNIASRYGPRCRHRPRSRHMYHVLIRGGSRHRLCERHCHIDTGGAIPKASVMICRRSFADGIRDPSETSARQENNCRHTNSQQKERRRTRSRLASRSQVISMADLR